MFGRSKGSQLTPDAPVSVLGRESGSAASWEQGTTPQPEPLPSHPRNGHDDLEMSHRLVVRQCSAQSRTSVPWRSHWVGTVQTPAHPDQCSHTLGHTWVGEHAHPDMHVRTGTPNHLNTQGHTHRLAHSLFPPQPPPASLGTGTSALTSQQQSRRPPPPASTTKSRSREVS